MRALAWSCFSAPLIADGDHCCDFTLTPERQAWLARLDADDRPLTDYLAQHCNSPRLGLVFESLWHFFLHQDPDFELLANNLPVRQQGRTLGEFDVILADRKQGVHVHLELAVKFFLARQGGDIDYQHWLGPNRADRLDRKIARLNEHQLRLAQTDGGRDALRELGVDHCHTHLRLAGLLFYPSDTACSGRGLHPEHERGRWLRRAEFGNRAHWRVLEKPLWLTADYERAVPITDNHWRRAQERPIMLINPALERCFVVPDNWPDGVHTAYQLNSSG